MRKLLLALCVLALAALGCASAGVKTDEDKAEAQTSPASPVEEQKDVKEEPPPAPTQPDPADSGKFALKRILIAPAIKDKEPFNPGEVFPSTVGKLYCFTHLVNAQSPKTITHAWFYKNAAMGKVRLKVDGLTWRTHSAKTINQAQIGPWRVEVLGPDGELLGTVNFEIR
ncbi:MAG: DUF2914 domain-containing protein [Desulfobacteraceae bacterium]|nr:MAG: DUF2914 domain-containing protein [Desulfobacteraceae bacterium]